MPSSVFILSARSTHARDKSSIVSEPFVNLKSDVIFTSSESATELIESGKSVPVIPFLSNSISFTSETVSSLSSSCSSLYHPSTKCSLLSLGNTTLVSCGFSSKQSSVVARTLRSTSFVTLSITAIYISLSLTVLSFSSPSSVYDTADVPSDIIAAVSALTEPDVPLYSIFVSLHFSPSYILYTIVSLSNSDIFSLSAYDVTERHATIALASFPLLPFEAVTGARSGVLLSLSLVVFQLFPSYIDAYISVPFIITFWSSYESTVPESFEIPAVILAHAATAKSPVPERLA